MLSILNIVYLFVLVIFTALYIFATPFLVIIFLLLRLRRIDDIFRYINQIYGYIMIKIFRPFIRLELSGKENINKNQCYIIVFNHFSELDVVFSTAVPVKNQMILVRNWVFNIMPYGFYMRMAGYINIDKNNFKKISRKTEIYFKRNVSLQIYPEGHRSQSGKLRRFKKGAFLLSCRFNIPVLPVCIKNANKFLSTCFPYFNPANIAIKILKPVYPEQFDNKENEMRKYIKKLYIKEFEE
jgi:1-acyl-sn-glycerol-3-phosphate acyltransferase